MSEMPEPVLRYACVDCGTVPATVGRLCAACEREYEPRQPVLDVDALAASHAELLAVLKEIVRYYQPSPDGFKRERAAIARAEAVRGEVTS